MADVVLVCVREDIERAEALAETFDAFGFSVSVTVDDNALRVCGAAVVLWSDAAQASSGLASVVSRVMATGRGVVLNLSKATAPDGATLCFDLSEWNGDPDDASLDRLFFALDRMVINARHARRTEPSEDVRPTPASKRMAVATAPPVARAAPAPALRVMATSLVVIGAVLAVGIAIGREHRAPVQAVVMRVPAEHGARARLSDVSPRGVSYDLSAGVVDDAPVGHRGLEPPSAVSTR